MIETEVCYFAKLSKLPSVPKRHTMKQRAPLLFLMLHSDSYIYWFHSYLKQLERNLNFPESTRWRRRWENVYTTISWQSRKSWARAVVRDTNMVANIYVNRIKYVVCESVQVYQREKKRKLNVSRMKRQWGYKKCNLHHTNWVIDSGRLYWHDFASFIEFDTRVNNATSVLVCLHPQKSYF